MRFPALVLLFLLIPILRAEDEAASATFPGSWEGVWKGTCQKTRGGVVATQFLMELHIKALDGRDGWTWQVVYGEGETQQVRAYELLPVDKDKGHYVIDEKNSILLDAFLAAGTLHIRFWVADNVIDVHYTVAGDNLTFDLTTYGDKPVRMSGGKGRTTPVASYALRSVQRAVLRRQ